MNARRPVQRLRADSRIWGDVTHSGGFRRSILKHPIPSSAEGDRPSMYCALLGDGGDRAVSAVWWDPRRLNRYGKSRAAVLRHRS